MVLKASVALVEHEVAPGEARMVTPTPPRDETAEILVMYSWLERAVSRLPADQAAPQGHTFSGFDARLEQAHYASAISLVSGSGLFDEFLSRPLDSGRPMLGLYRQLLARFQIERRSGLTVNSNGAAALQRLFALH